MKRPLSLALFLALPLCPLFGGTLSESYRINDHGQLREFEIARDEIQQNQMVVRIQARATAEETRAAARKAGGNIVLYETGAPRGVSTRRLLTRRIAVQVAPGTDAAALTRAAGAESANPAPGGAGWVVLQASTDAGSALDVTASLRGQPGVLAIEPLLARKQSKRETQPNDQFFGDQWHLVNNGASGGLAGIDLNVLPVWETLGLQGQNRTVGIVDDGLEHTHPDLTSNYDAADSYDFNYDTPDPQPTPFDGDDHGTACAGLAAAVGDNTIGVCGVAYRAHLAGIRLIALPDTDEQEAEAFLFHNDVIDVKSNSWGPADDGKTLAGPGPLAAAALETAVQTGRGGLGTIFTWAGGNGGLVGDASTFDGYASSREVIAVGALTNRGVKAPYSEPGTNLICVAPSDGGTLSITTVDRPGNDGYNFVGERGDLPDLDYTNSFGGTSAASPQVAGCVALMLQANPLLGWRDVQEIIIQTARQIDASNPGWVSNGNGFHYPNSTGYHFNNEYGAGLIDANAAVALAKTWKILGPETSISAPPFATMGTAFSSKKPLGGSQGIPFTFAQPNFRIEHVVVTVDIQHASRGDVEVALVSPTDASNSRQEILAPFRPRDKSANFDHWAFMSTQHWGEMATGTWAVKVTAKAGAPAGIVNGIQVQFYGATAPIQAAPSGYQVVADTNNNGVVDPGELVTVSFPLLNAGADPATGLTAALQSSPNIVNPTATAQSYGTLNSGVSGTQNFTFTAMGNLGDTIQAVLNVSYMDGATPVNSVVNFPITLGTIATATFNNLTGTDGSAVAIPSFSSMTGAGNASPYPSTLQVMGLPGNAVITNLVLHLNYLGHSRANAIAMLLVDPSGTKAMVPMSDAGVGPADEVTLTLTDSALVALPNDEPLFSGTFLPTNNAATTHVFPAPASPKHSPTPPKPTGTGFSTFNGLNPAGPGGATGTWQLYIRDIKSGGFGGLGNWSLDITYAH